VRAAFFTTPQQTPPPPSLFSSITTYLPTYLPTYHLRLSSTSFDFFSLIFQSFLYTPFDISTKNLGNPLDWIS